jgi:hypothetical protein
VGFVRGVGFTRGVGVTRGVGFSLFIQVDKCYLGRGVGVWGSLGV